jgi:hypothetical protein
MPSRERRDPRFAAMVPALLGTVLLVGFCLYLAVQLGILPSPFGSGTTPTPVITQGTVPSLLGEDYTTAQSTAQQAGFTLQLSGTSTAGIVAGQNPPAGSRYSKGSAIYVTMTTKTRVPTYRQGETLEAVEQLILGAHLQYKVLSDGADPTLGANAVSRLDPPSGSQVDLNTVVIIYVKNLGGTPSASPAPTSRPQ